jgi:curli biogenesis system outer membrane secretion channel CsgG/TolA-binding protein
MNYEEEKRMQRKLWGLIAVFFILTVWGTAAPAADDIVRIGVMEFVSKADGVSAQQADVIRDFFTRYLANAKKIAVLERERLLSIGAEHKLNYSGLVDSAMAVEIGRLAGCQYMLFGSVTELSEKMSAGAVPIPVPIIGGGLGGGEHEAKATIDARVIDVTTGETVLYLSEEGTSQESSQAIVTRIGSIGESQFGGLKARAIEAAVVKLGSKLLEEISGEYAHVLSAGGKTVRISRGAKSGVKKGGIYLIYVDGPEVFDIDGESLGRDRFPIAVVKVVDVLSGFSNCEIAPAGGKMSNIQRGDRIQPISAKEAKEYVTRKLLPSERPKRRAYQDTASQLFGGGSGPAVPDTAPAIESTSAGKEALEKEPEDVPPKPSVTTSRPAGGGAFKWNEVDGVDMNATTDVKLMDIYPMTSAERNTLRIQHSGAYKVYTQRKYKDAFEVFSRLATVYDFNYLSAYWAGVCAVRLGKGSYKEAEKWFYYALSINPDYKPALAEKHTLTQAKKK